jgi:hypothetical protein
LTKEEYESKETNKSIVTKEILREIDKYVINSLEYNKHINAIKNYDLNLDNLIKDKLNHLKDYNHLRYDDMIVFYNYIKFNFSITNEEYKFYDYRGYNCHLEIMIGFKCDVIDNYILILDNSDRYKPYTRSDKFKKIYK